MHDRPPPEPAVLGFTEAAKAGGTDFDVLMGYQLLLGRDPENSFVIADAKTSPVGAFIRALLGSGEFQSAVVEPIRSGRRLPHEAASAAPSKRQRDWLFRHISLPPDAEIMLRTAPSWRDWMRVLLSVPGMPQAQAQADTAPSSPETVAKTADEGFVMIHLEQPAAGEAIHPGMRVNGSGWTIAPDDVSEVAILLDDQVLTHARYGLPRPDVARGFPHYRHVDHCGFSFVADIPQTARVSAASRLVVRVRTGRGDEGEKGVRLLPPPATPAAAESDAAPMRLAIDEAVIDEGRVLRLRGWAAAQAGIGSVRVALGKSELGPAVTGLSRPDIAKANPDTADADKAGFALVIGLPPELPAGPSFVRVQSERCARPDPAGERTGHRAASRKGCALRQVDGRSRQRGCGRRRRRCRRQPICGWSSTSRCVMATRRAKRCAAHCRFPVGQWLGRGSTASRCSSTAPCWVRRMSACGARISAPPFPIFRGSLLAGYALVLPPGALPEGRHQIRVVAHAKSADGATAARAEKRFFPHGRSVSCGTAGRRAAPANSAGRSGTGCGTAGAGRVPSCVRGACGGGGQGVVAGGCAQPRKPFGAGLPGVDCAGFRPAWRACGRARPAGSRRAQIFVCRGKGGDCKAGAREACRHGRAAFSGEVEGRRCVGGRRAARNGAGAGRRSQGGPALCR